MLVNDDINIIGNAGDPVMGSIFAILGNGRGANRIVDGIYEIGHFGSSSWLPRNEYYASYDYYQDRPLSICEYGVCDNYQQILEQCPELVDSGDRKFVVTITPIVKAEQPSEGGWRWHKWGPYIGTEDPQCEYIYDEPVIDKVYVYHIYERRV